MSKPILLAALPPAWNGLWRTRLSDGTVRLVRYGTDAFDPAAIDYVLSFRPPPGLLKSLPHLKAVFSMGAGIDGFLAAGDYPAAVPLFRFVDPTLTREMAQYVLMHVLIRHRGQREFDAAQNRADWIQAMMPRRTEETRIGILGLGEIGGFVADLFVRLGFPVLGWSRRRKSLPGVESFAGREELTPFFSRSDVAVCLLPLTGETRGILDRAAFAAMPEGGFVVNVARGAHLNVPDLVAALDSGHLSGAVLDVFETEPLPAADPLWRHPKIAVTPHVAAISQPEVAAAYVLDGIARFERGEMPDHRVNLSAGY
jgi:glyoxylate/hydroxypyruvate reductase A